MSTLPRDALAIRRKFLGMHFAAQAGHLGTGLSAIDILTYLYRVWLRSNDHFILGKGHGASSLYATLHHFERLSDLELASYYKDGTLLPAHPAPNGVSEILAATGSLGHGLPIATGMAYSFKNLQHTDARLACLLSDGDCNEGSTWEAALFAAHHRLDNLTVIVDANGIQGFGRTDDVLALEPFAKKWEAFGFAVSECNGHEFAALHQALSQPGGGRPRCLIARTVKGKGVKFMEDKVEWHYWPMTEAQYREALADLEQAERELTG